MPHYHTLGRIPDKRHVQFRKPFGGLYAEQLVSTEGFSDIYSLTYHVYPPTRVIGVEEPYSVKPDIALRDNMQNRSFLGFRVKPAADFPDSRVPLLVNDDINISMASPRKSMEDYFYKNSSADELLFIHIGSGEIMTMYGKIPFRYGDHVVIPRGTIYQIRFDTPENKILVLESFSPIRYPGKYINRHGQLLEHAPYCERDIRKPESLETHDEEGDFRILIKKDGLVYPYHYGTHPFDVIGWDGYHYPWAFSIFDFEPITGRIHQPPPVHQTFEGRNFVLCAFVPRMYDYHPEAIVVPYNHSNVDSDEVLYYVDGEFMSRKNVEQGQFTLHPIGIPHGPHPGAVERGLGQKETRELAVMIDTFKPLMITRQALEIEDKDYFRSWMEQ